MKTLSSTQRDLDRQQAADWANSLLQGRFLIVDVETTGFGDAEICELAVIDQTGRTLISTLIKPAIAIPKEATDIHGITDRDVVNAPTFAEIHPMLFRWTLDENLCAYSLDFDLRMLRQSCDLAALPRLLPVAAACAMRWYAQWFGDWQDGRSRYRWQSLAKGDHTALGDCRATLALIQRMAESCQPGLALVDEVELPISFEAGNPHSPAAGNPFVKPPIASSPPNVSGFVF